MRLETAIKFHPKFRPELYMVSRGDILFTARGLDHRAYLLDQDLSDVLATATFYILRPERGRILPRYLAWWLNLPRVQSAIGRESGGTYNQLHQATGDRESGCSRSRPWRCNTGSSASSCSRKSRLGCGHVSNRNEISTCGRCVNAQSGERRIRRESDDGDLTRGNQRNTLAGMRTPSGERSTPPSTRTTSW